MLRALHAPLGDEHRVGPLRVGPAHRPGGRDPLLDLRRALVAGPEEVERARRRYGAEDDLDVLAADLPGRKGRDAVEDGLGLLGREIAEGAREREAKFRQVDAPPAGDARGTGGGQWITLGRYSLSGSDLMLYRPDGSKALWSRE